MCGYFWVNTYESIFIQSERKRYEMWLLFFAVMIFFALGTFAYLALLLGTFPLFGKIMGSTKKSNFWRGLLLLIAITAILLLIFGPADTLIILFHLLVFWILFHLLCIPLSHKKNVFVAKSTAGCAAILFTAIFLAIGWYNCNHISETDYSIHTEKSVGNLRIAQISDVHLGTTFSGEEFVHAIDQISETKPDILLITGDFVDDSTSLEDMQKGCQSLGQAQTTYGVFYVFGNHDKGYHPNRRGFSGDDLIAALEANQVTVLQDETVLIDDRFYLIGRQDKGEDKYGNGRKTTEELVENLDSSKYTIVLDHQPCDYEDQSASKVDLVLSGHTHGGQFFPLNIINTYVSANDRVYGHEKLGDTDFIVSSGIGNWAMRFKTGCISEFVIVDITCS